MRTRARIPRVCLYLAAALAALHAPSLAAADGNLSKAARALGLSSRYALYRLMKKHGIDVGALREPDD